MSVAALSGLRHHAHVIDLPSVLEIEQRVGAARVDVIVEVDHLRLTILEHHFGEADLRRARSDGRAACGLRGD